MAAKKTSKKTASKADFVRAHANLSPKEIVEKAKAESVKLNASYVYNIRAYDKTKAKKTSAKRGARRTTVRKAVAVQRPIANRSSAEDLLKALGAELGLAHAIEILQGERERVRAVLGG